MGVAVRPVQQIDKNWLEDVLIRQEDPARFFWHILRVFENLGEIEEEGRV